MSKFQPDHGALNLNIQLRVSLSVVAAQGQPQCSSRHQYTTLASITCSVFSSSRLRGSEVTLTASHSSGLLSLAAQVPRIDLTSPVFSSIGGGVRESNLFWFISSHYLQKSQDSDSWAVILSERQNCSDRLELYSRSSRHQGILE